MVKRMLILEIHEIVSRAKEKRYLFMYVCQIDHGKKIVIKWLLVGKVEQYSFLIFTWNVMYTVITLQTNTDNRSLHTDTRSYEYLPIVSKYTNIDFFLPGI